MRRSTRAATSSSPRAAWAGRDGFSTSSTGGRGRCPRGSSRRCTGCAGAANRLASVPPALSIVTPSYNGGRYITHTLDSVAALTVTHEHLVIDGGSTDDTISILEARDDPSLIWISEPDRGQTHAMNKGFE